MKKRIFAMMALAAALCACSKEQDAIYEPQTPDANPQQVKVFTATMEGAPETKATFDDAAKCASWEVGDQICINEALYFAQKAGTSSYFKIPETREIRPLFESSINKESYNNSNPTSNLVDDAGTSTRWCVSESQKRLNMWCIVVSTTNKTFLKSIKLWNADNTASYPDRVWKDIVVKGTTHTHSSEWAFSDTLTLDLAANNGGLAGEIAIDATQACDLYMIEILTNKGDEYMQMGDMKFVVSYPDNLEPPYKAYFPAYLFNGKYQELPEIITETWTDGKFNMPMYAESNTTNLNFKNICGVLKITVKKDVMPSVKSFHISSSDKAISGTVYVNAKNEAVLVEPSKPENALTVNYTQAVNTSDQGTNFYIAIPPQTYRDLSIMISADGLTYKHMVTKSGVDITVERNKIYPVAFTSDGTTGSAYATGPRCNVEWVQLWEDGPKFAVYNLGVTNGRPESYGGYYDRNSGESANKLWGDNWRMPTKEELDGLLANCDAEWMTLNGVSGYKFTGTGRYAYHSIFLPAGGFNDAGGYPGSSSEGFYYSSTPSASAGSFYLFFENGRKEIQGTPNWFHLSVRAVLAE